MDWVFLMALLGLAGLSAGLLALCARLAGNLPAAGIDHGGLHGQDALARHSASDRGL